jgi:hypothetical protein
MVQESDEGDDDDGERDDDGDGDDDEDVPKSRQGRRMEMLNRVAEDALLGSVILIAYILIFCLSICLLHHELID